MENYYVSPNYALDVYYQLPCIDQCMTGEEWKLFTVLFNQIMIATQHDKIKVEPIEIEHEWIANKIGKNKRTSIRNVERLRQLGVIKVTKACRHSNKYELNWNVINAIAQSQIENMDKIVTNTCDKNVTNTNIHDKNVTDDMDKNVTNTDNTCDKNVTNTCDKNVSTIGDKNVTQIINNINKENKENTKNPVIENTEAISIFDSDFGDFKDSPNNLQKENEVTENPVCDSPKSNSDSKSKPYRVNLNYIDDLERQFNGYTDATSPNAAENSPKATANPKTTETQNPKIDEKFRALLFPNPNITSDYIKSLNCSEYKDLNPTILLDLIEAAKQTTLVIDAMNKAIEWLRTFFGTKGMKCIAQVYVYAKQIIKPTNGSEKWFKYASDVRETLSKEIIKYGGGEVLKEVVRNSQVTDVE